MGSGKGASFTEPPIFEKLGIPGEYEAATVGGWVTEQLGRIPQAGDSFHLDDPGLTVRVSQADEVHVLEVQLIPDPKEKTGAPEA